MRNARNDEIESVTVTLAEASKHTIQVSGVVKYSAVKLRYCICVSPCDTV
jgi:hypothetical protein